MKIKIEIALIPSETKEGGWDAYATQTSECGVEGLATPEQALEACGEAFAAQLKSPQPLYPGEVSDVIVMATNKLSPDQSYQMLKIPVALAPEDDGSWTISSRLFPYCFSDGNSFDDAKWNIKKALDFCFEGGILEQEAGLLQTAIIETDALDV